MASARPSLSPQNHLHGNCGFIAIIDQAEIVCKLHIEIEDKTNLAKLKAEAAKTSKEAKLGEEFKALQSLSTTPVKKSIIGLLECAFKTEHHNANSRDVKLSAEISDSLLKDISRYENEILTLPARTSVGYFSFLTSDRDGIQFSEKFKKEFGTFVGMVKQEVIRQTYDIHDAVPSLAISHDAHVAEPMTEEELELAAAKKALDEKDRKLSKLAEQAEAQRAKLCEAEGKLATALLNSVIEQQSRGEKEVALASATQSLGEKELALATAKLSLIEKDEKIAHLAKDVDDVKIELRQVEEKKQKELHQARAQGAELQLQFQRQVEAQQGKQTAEWQRKLQQQAEELSALKKEVEIAKQQAAELKKANTDLQKKAEEAGRLISYTPAEHAKIKKDNVFEKLVDSYVSDLKFAKMRTDVANKLSKSEYATSRTNPLLTNIDAMYAKTSHFFEKSLDQCKKGDAKKIEKITEKEKGDMRALQDEVSDLEKRSLTHCGRSIRAATGWRSLQPSLHAMTLLSASNSPRSAGVQHVSEQAIEVSDEQLIKTFFAEMKQRLNPQKYIDTLNLIIHSEGFLQRNLNQIRERANEKKDERPSLLQHPFFGQMAI